MCINTAMQQKNLIKAIESIVKGKGTNNIKLRDYQEEAIEAWITNNYKGFYVMATGTGKLSQLLYMSKMDISVKKPVDMRFFDSYIC